MAIVRTVLPRKGFVQPQHGITQYEGDMDSNMSLLDANVAFMSDLASVADSLVGDLGLNGLVSGFQLATSNTLYPSVTTGILYANGSRYAPTKPHSQRGPGKCHLLPLLSTGKLAEQLLLPARPCRPGSWRCLHWGHRYQCGPGHERDPGDQPVWPDPGGAHRARQFYGAASVRARSHRRARPHDQPGGHLVAIADGRGRRKPLSRCLRRWGNCKGAGMVKKTGFRIQILD